MTETTPEPINGPNELRRMDEMIREQLRRPKVNMRERLWPTTPTGDDTTDTHGTDDTAA